ncbi:extracellular metalloprotease NCU07200 [Patellaria atrata CBS 101060]|uniref:Extracellular metalloprotease NCU07200 n=1 Tax=Patellaria atrata CBS 101060 TaxID=1346257 RepID=A0A9P4S1H6_9PEZI|nr:extracellular metalloprotease NCU07200 [Patellaria atrata CBS 101060]
MLPRSQVDRSFGCGTAPSEEYMSMLQGVATDEQDASSARVFAAAEDPVVIDTYFHVVAASTNLADGYVTDQQLADQIAVLNEEYAPYGFQFDLKGTDRTINGNWSVDSAELDMKIALRKGDYKALNVYFQKQIGGNLGYCYFPTFVGEQTEDFYYDGCSILFSSVPGGNATNYNLGKTLTHEVGHWFGLLHTFQGNSCDGVGDIISDTPQQLSATRGCPVGRDSCPDAAGLDPIHNYMDYSYDACYEEFTPKQHKRMHNMFDSFRAEWGMKAKGKRDVKRSRQLRKKSPVNM